MKRAFVLSLILHLGVLSGVLLWWSGRDEHRSFAVRVSTTRPPETRPGAEPKSESARAKISPPVSPGSPGESTSEFRDPEPPAASPENWPQPEILPAAAVPIEPVWVPAALVTDINPNYPREARRRNWEGVVEVLVEVDVGGQWRAGRVTTSSGHTLLDEAALQALKAADFRPATRDGAPEPGTLTVRVVFVLKN